MSNDNFKAQIPKVSFLVDYFQNFTSLKSFTDLFVITKSRLVYVLQK